jgi:sensor domain CHASE-containing protein
MEKVGMAGAEGDENVLKNMETFLIALIGIVILILCTLVIKLFINRV